MSNTQCILIRITSSNSNYRRAFAGATGEFCTMPPKKKAGKSKTKADPIKKPIVTDSDYAKAQKLLEDETELKRQRSSLSFYLQTHGQKEEFSSWDPKERKKFLITYLADKLASGNLKSTAKTLRTVDSRDTRKRWCEWWNKKQMIDTWGQEKAEARIKSGKLKTQPDSVTGEHGEFLTEYKIWFDTSGTENSDRQRSEVGGDEEINSAEKAKAAHDMIDDMAGGLLGGTCSGDAAASGSGGDTTEIKTEIKTEPVAPTPGLETMKTIRDNVRKVLRSCGDTITELKFMFEKSKGDPYQEPLHDQIHKLIPKMSTSFKALETVAVKPADHDDAALLVIGKKLDEQYETYNKLGTIFDRLNPKERSGKKPKAA